MSIGGLNISNEIIEARTTYNIHKEELKEILEEWAKYLDMKPENDILGLIMTGAVVQLIKQSLDNVGKFKSAIEKYIDLMGKRLKEVDVLFQ